MKQASYLLRNTSRLVSGEAKEVYTGSSKYLGGKWSQTFVFEQWKSLFFHDNCKVCLYPRYSYSCYYYYYGYLESEVSVRVRLSAVCNSRFILISYWAI